MGNPEEVGREPMMDWALVMGSRRMWAPGSGSSLGGWGYLSGGTLEEEGTEEQIAKADRWCSQWASHAHPDGGPDAERHPFQSSGGGVGRGLGQQPVSSLCVSVPASVPKPVQVP